MLVSAAKFFGNDEWLKIAAGNVDFVLAAQNADGSWPYAKDGVRDFVDHFHTGFVMKALAKIFLQNGDQRILAALTKGVDYLRQKSFWRRRHAASVLESAALDGLQVRALRLRRVHQLVRAAAQTISATAKNFGDRHRRILKKWVKPDGSFRSRKLILGWDNVPMHRWAQSQMFRALAFYLREHRPTTLG